MVEKEAEVKQQEEIKAKGSVRGKVSLCFASII
jgi:hypothetical protein